MPVEFETDRISLELHSEEDNLNDGWKIVALFSPVVRNLQQVCTLLARDCDLIAMLVFFYRLLRNMWTALGLDKNFHIVS